MDRIQKGMLAESRAGHDCGRLYMIIDFDEKYVYLADDKLRCLDKLKKKKNSHVQIIKTVPEKISRALSEGSLNDEMIRKALKESNDRFN